MYKTHLHPRTHLSFWDALLQIDTRSNLNYWAGFWEKKSDTCSFCQNAYFRAFLESSHFTNPDDPVTSNFSKVQIFKKLRPF